MNAPDKSLGRHEIELLENGEGFFSAALAAIEQARSEVLLETFILAEDKVGQALQAALRVAARRGARVSVVVDGFGTPSLSDTFVGKMVRDGIEVRVFDPTPRLSRRLGLLRRLHRKLLVVDGVEAYVGGTNFSADHLIDSGPMSKLDFAVRVRGEVVDRLRRESLGLLTYAGGQAGRSSRRRDWRSAGAGTEEPARDTTVFAVIRDNTYGHRHSIEHHYCEALRHAQHEATIACAYFFPGRRLLAALTAAARRGVSVRLILQGQPDMPWAAFLSQLLYGHLLRAGVAIHEYHRRPLHAKVATIDDDWSTVGSSNLEPLSLALNLEANLVIRDPRFVGVLRARLQQIIEDDCRRIDRTEARRLNDVWKRCAGVLARFVLARYEQWARMLPPHRPRLVEAGAPATDSSGQNDDAPPAAAADRWLRHSQRGSPLSESRE